uniref:Uncharacterized protein n=1 Tax=viral metagenome TaxID=1070528 RepID=A0A6C0HM39_9ZZZZ
MPYTKYDFAFILVILELFEYFNEDWKDDNGVWYWRDLNDGDAILKQVTSDIASKYDDIPTIRANLLSKYHWFSKYLGTEERPATGRSAITRDLKAILQAEMTVENGFVITQQDDVCNQRTYFINGVMAIDIFKIYDEHRNSDGKLHRGNDLPAITFLTGTKVWLRNGKRYRKRGLPAVEHFNGDKEWWRKDKRHRNGGLPAVVCTNGHKEWWRNHKLHRDNDLPAVVYANGRQEWYIDDTLHRDNDLPAIEHPNGDNEWWFNGERHRDGIMPAIEYANGEVAWYVNGQEFVGFPRILTGNIPLWVNGNRYRNCTRLYRTI